MIMAVAAAPTSDGTRRHRRHPRRPRGPSASSRPWKGHEPRVGAGWQRRLGTVGPCPESAADTRDMHGVRARPVVGSVAHLGRHGLGSGTGPAPRGRACRGSGPPTTTVNHGLQWGVDDAYGLGEVADEIDRLRGQLDSAYEPRVVAILERWPTGTACARSPSTCGCRTPRSPKPSTGCSTRPIAQRAVERRKRPALDPLHVDGGVTVQDRRHDPGGTVGRCGHIPAPGANLSSLYFLHRVHSR